MHAGIASLAGLGLGIYAAFRLRAMRMAYFNAFRAMEKPVEVRFADGRAGTPTSEPHAFCRMLISVFRTHPRHLRSAITLAMGRRRDILTLLRRWTVSWWRIRPHHRYGVGITNDHEGPSGEGEDRESIQELQNRCSEAGGTTVTGQEQVRGVFQLMSER